MNLFTRNPRRFGGYLIHLGVVILLAGVAINASYKVEKRMGEVAVGQSVAVGGYRVTLEAMRTEQSSARSAVIGTFRVTGADGKDLGTVNAEKAFYPNQDQPVTEVGIRSTPMADIYIILTTPDPEKGVVAVSYLINPGMYWVWVGALVVIIGGVIVGWPHQRRREGPKGVPDATGDLVAASTDA